jgi:hypothetical protein
MAATRSPRESPRAIRVSLAREDERE